MSKWRVGKEISHISSALRMHNLFPIVNISHQSGTLVITDEPTVIYHNYPSPYVYIRVHYLCFTFYGSNNTL